jgi:hypothetical protein
MVYGCRPPLQSAALFSLSFTFRDMRRHASRLTSSLFTLQTSVTCLVAHTSRIDPQCP